MNGLLTSSLRSGGFTPLGQRCQIGQRSSSLTVLTPSTERGPSNSCVVTYVGHNEAVKTCGRVRLLPNLWARCQSDLILADFASSLRRCRSTSNRTIPAATETFND